MSGVTSSGIDQCLQNPPRKNSSELWPVTQRSIKRQTLKNFYCTTFTCTDLTYEAEKIVIETCYKPNIKTKIIVHLCNTVSDGKLLAYLRESLWKQQENITQPVYFIEVDRWSSEQHFKVLRLLLDISPIYVAIEEERTLGQFSSSAGWSLFTTHAKSEPNPASSIADNTKSKGVAPLAEEVKPRRFLLKF